MPDRAMWVLVLTPAGIGRYCLWTAESQRPKINDRVPLGSLLIRADLKSLASITLCRCMLDLAYSCLAGV